MKSNPNEEEFQQVSGSNLELESSQCAFCLRIMKAGTTKHHLIPRRCHKNRWFQKRYSRGQMQITVPACKDCHNAIHRLIPSEKELGKDHNTVEKLLAHEGFAKFVGWAKRQR